MSCKNSVKNISQAIKDMFSVSRPKLPPIPPFLLAFGASFRPGLSPQMIASRIIKRMPEAGGYSGPLADGSKNVMEGMYSIMVEEIINSIILESKVDVAFKPGAIAITSMGGNAGGPVVSNGYNIGPASANGTVR